MKNRAVADVRARIRSCIFAAICMSPAVVTAQENMQAMVLTGGQLQMQAVPRPVPGAGEVRIKVRAAGVNPADWKRAQRGSVAAYIPGWDVAGVIDAVGTGITGFKVGDPVMAFFEGVGGYAQYVNASTGVIAAKPQMASFEEAAGIPLVAITAWKALIDVADLKAGQRVLIHGGAGGVGSAAVQIAKSRGAHVIATASPRNHDYLKSIGADEIIDYNTVRFEDRLTGLDVVLNTVDDDTATRSLKVLKPDGMLVTVAGAATPEACAAAKVRCATQSRRSGTPINELLTEVGRLVDAGKYDVHVDAVLPLADAGKAWETNRAGHTRGKIVLTVPQ